MASPALQVLAQRESEAGHVLAEDDLPGGGIQEVGHRLATRCGDLVCGNRGVITATKVAYAVFENRLHRLDGDLRHLGSTGPVEISHLSSVFPPAESRKMPADLLNWRHR
jgi:hypothetical protein